MINKVFNYIVPLVMMLVVLGCIGCNDNSLVDYRTTKLTTLQDYADEKEQDKYTMDGWAVICKATVNGKKAIEDAATKTAVTKAFDEARGIIDSVEEKKTVSDFIKNGAYFITDTSWELYIHKWIKDNENQLNGIDDELIQKAIDGKVTIKDSNGLVISTPIRNRMWIAVHSDMLSVNNDSYQFVRDGAVYTGQNLNTSISFVLSGNILIIEENGNVLEYKFDESYSISDNELAKFSAPTNVIYTYGGERLNYASFSWNPDYESGYFGAGIEIKKADSEDYALVMINYPYHYTYVTQFSSDFFTQGINIIRIYYIGGPSLNKNTKQVHMIQNSEYELFNVIVDINGNVKIEEKSK